MGSPPDDPYTRFLGLAEGRRPPHLYDLLELELFCSQREWIEHAVRKQFRRIKPYEDNPNRKVREAIQDIMNQIATARVVLTDSDRKEKYDVELAETLGIDRDALLASKVATPVPEHEVLVTAGPLLVGQRIHLATDMTVTIGSDPHCVLTLDSRRVAPLHARLRYDDNDGWEFEQIDRHHFALVNDERTPRHVMAEGDGIDIGGFRLRFRRIGDGTNPAETASLPPLSLTLQAGPSIPEPHCNALPPERILIGEDDTALWRLEHPRVSRHHCRIEPAGGIWTITDLDSTNGTRVNEDGVGHEFPLKHRDRILIDPFEILVSFRR
jgi:pSer/pThr/pTyr-binding forkhead associated (FHA) protein